MTLAPLYPSRRSPVMADNAIATSQPLATQAGLSVLARGGNAVDAALAAAIMAGSAARRRSGGWNVADRRQARTRARTAMPADSEPRGAPRR